MSHSLHMPGIMGKGEKTFMMREKKKKHLSKPKSAQPMWLHVLWPDETEAEDFGLNPKRSLVSVLNEYKNSFIFQINSINLT